MEDERKGTRISATEALSTQLSSSHDISGKHEDKVVVFHWSVWWSSTYPVVDFHMNEVVVSHA